MNRRASFTFLALGLINYSTAAQVDLAPAPREIRPDGSRDPVSSAAPVKKENPLVVVERIIKNANAVGDNLSKTDTGAETLGKQVIILKDIKSLIDQKEEPPPKPDQSKDDQKSDDQDKKDMANKGDKGDKKDKEGMPPMPMGKDMGNKSDMGDKSETEGDQPMARRPRRQGSKEPKEPKEPSGQQEPAGNKQQPQPMNSTPMQPPKNTGGNVPDPKPGDPKRPGVPVLPIEDEIVKEVWGHLTDKMRQQATQYYQQDFMPRYTELLKLYYSSLAEKGGKR